MRAFTQVDVFHSERACSGNPVAVILDAAGLSDDTLAAVARWTMLSETTFLLPPTQPGADYKVRIFMGSGTELPFAGHPTLGSAAAWLAAGGRPNGGVVVQECGAGLVEVRVDGDVLAFRAPPLVQSGPLDDATLAMACRCLGVEPDAVVAHAWGVNGPRWAMVQLADADAVVALRPEPTVLSEVEVGAIGLAAGSDHAYVVRGFARPPVLEDPVTGSLNAAAAQWLRGRGLVPERYTVRQGQQIGFDGEVFVTDDGDGVWIGGRVTPLITGSIHLP